MSVRILIAPDSFKECNDSLNLAHELNRNLESENNSIFQLRPITDGGDGFLGVCGNNFQLKELKYSISNAYNDERMECLVGYEESNKRMFIESANIVGLKKIPLDKRKPLTLSSKGLGELLTKIKNDVEKNLLQVNTIYLGIGGTGTIDLGLGMCSVFGIKIFDFYSKEMPVLPENYYRIGGMSILEIQLPFRIIPVVDVNISLFEGEGIIRKFGTQKGATTSDMILLELGFKKVINFLQKKNMISNEKSLSGAGGGIAAALQIFFNSEIVKAKDFILDILNLKNEISSSDIIITGEGKLDSQSLLGKGAFAITQFALQQNKKVFFICGRCEVDFHKMENDNFTIIELADFFNSVEESICNINQGISKVCDVIKSKL